MNPIEHKSMSINYPIIALWLIKDKHMVTNEIRELNYTVL